MFKKIGFLICTLFVLQTFAQKHPLVAADSLAQSKWVDSIMNKMTLDQKIGQLFMVASYSNRDEAHAKEIEKLINQYEIGGVIFFQGTIEGHAKLINRYQSVSKVPLLVGIDAEWGLNMRLDNTTPFPYNMALGAIKDDQLIEEFGVHVAKHIKRLGMQVDFAPSVDINVNPENPIIGNRSFGEDRDNVTEKAARFIKGMQSQGVLVSAKHFPGHGDTATDSHKALPVLDFSMERLDSIELYPYRKLIPKGLTGVMVSHLSVPAIEPNNNTPASISDKAIAKLLKEDMKFQGLIYTDALNMQGITSYVNPGEIDYMAFIAGNDVLLFAESVAMGHKKIKQAYEKNVITKERLDHSVRKILMAKYWSGLNKYKPVDLNHLKEDLNTVQDELLMRKLVAGSITAVKNEKDLLPLKDLEKNKIAYVKLGQYENETFVKRLNDYTKVDVIKGNTLDVVLEQLKPYQTVIMGFHTNGKSAYSSYKFSETDLHWIQEIGRKHNVVLNVFASPYSLLQLKSTVNIESILVSYQNTPVFQDLSAQMIFGAMDIKGRLPVNISKEFGYGKGLDIADIKRLGYSIPEDVCLDSEKLNRIDSVANRVIKEKMAPGLQVLVAKEGKVVYRKNFGYYTYDNKKPVTDESIYDLASVTKILGGLPMIMKAEEEEKFTIDSKLGDLIPVLKGSNKEGVTVKEALSHYGKLKPFITFYKPTLDPVSSKPLDLFYTAEPGSKFNIQVADHLYLRDDYEQEVFKQIAEAPQNSDLDYKYSDLPFILFKDYLENAYNKPLDQLNDEFFYAPLGASTMTYNPLKKFEKERIAPTENDTYFRNQQLQGTVHDESAAMLGGISGNAGLFSNANDVAKMMQMYMQGGYYGGKNFLKTETIDAFNHRYYQDKGNRRGLGFDKPELDPKEKSTCGCVSMHSFGHSGYTGTYTFADPETQIVYVFLSNRVYPSRDNNKLSSASIRSEVQRLIQESILE